MARTSSMIDGMAHCFRRDRGGRCVGWWVGIALCVIISDRSAPLRRVVTAIIALGPSSSCRKAPRAAVKSFEGRAATG